MHKRPRWFSSVLAFGLLVVIVWCSGCAETWKGFQRDWQHWQDVDKEFQENWW